MKATVLLLKFLIQIFFFLINNSMCQIQDLQVKNMSQNYRWPLGQVRTINVSVYYLNETAGWPSTPTWIFLLDAENTVRWPIYCNITTYFQPSQVYFHLPVVIVKISFYGLGKPTSDLTLKSHYVSQLSGSWKI